MTTDRKTAPVDFRDLMGNVEDVVAAIEPSDDLDLTVRQLAVEIISRFRHELGVFGGRVYRRDGGDYRLEAAFPDEGGTAPLGLAVPESYAPIQVLLDRRTIYWSRDDPRLDRTIEEALGVKEFAAIEVSDGTYVLAFDIEPGRDHGDVLISLGILRHVINQKLREEKIDSALREARRIQSSILPRRIPKFGQFEIACRSKPMEIVGGDYYDLIELTDKILGVAVADVSGHGLPAALLVRDVYMGLRMGMSRDLKIARILEQLNTIIHNSRLTSRFVSMFYGELDQSGTLIYVNAGHPPPIYLPAAGGLRFLTEGGAVLGPIQDATYERGFVSLGPGDRIVIYTDGIVEAESASGEEFGVDRLLDIVREGDDESAKRLLDRVFAAVGEFTAHRPADDDRTLLVLRQQG
jgi:sigma-B regulation protein RsbU (phosphoserine phosphatase)